MSAAPRHPETPAPWTAPELANPHAAADKAAKVRGMFSAIAPSYDLNNRLHSLWLDQHWRRTAISLAGVKPGDQVLDVACGTGDLTAKFAQTAAAGVMGVDFTPAMLDVARRKATELPPRVSAKIRYEEGDAQHLRFTDASFDVASIAFGIRNVANPAQALHEFYRTLRTGGRLIILEFGQPTNPLMRWVNNWYCGGIMPRTATLISGDTSGAYKYLPASVGTFWTPAAMREALAAAGFTNISATLMTLGVAVCYRAEKH